MNLEKLIFVLLLIAYTSCKSKLEEGKEFNKNEKGDESVTTQSVLKSDDNDYQEVQNKNELLNPKINRKLKFLNTYFVLEIENNTGKIFYENGEGYTTIAFVQKTNDGKYIWDEYSNGKKTATLEFNDNNYSAGAFIRLKDNERFSFEEFQNSSYNTDELRKIIQGNYDGECKSTNVYGEIMFTKYNIEINSRFVFMTAIFNDGQPIKESGEYSFLKDSNKDEGQIRVTFSGNTHAKLSYVEANGYYYLFLDKSYCYPTGIRLVKDSELNDSELMTNNSNNLNNSSFSYQGVDLTYFDKQTGFIKNDEVDGYVKENVGYWNSVLISPNKGVMMFLITDPTVANWLEVTDDLIEIFGKETQNDDNVPFTINDANRLPQEIKNGNAVYKRMWKSTNTDVGSLVLMWYTEGILLVISRKSMD